MNKSLYIPEVLGNQLTAESAIELSGLQTLKKGIYLYFLLLIFEGALRKWVLPGLATPLLIIRDPLALYLIILAWQKGLLPLRISLVVMVFIGIAGLYTAVWFGHGNLVVALYGSRILLFHFPLMFVIGQVLTREDVLKVGRWTMVISLPMVVLIALQFYSPQSAWVNRGIGGDMEGGGFAGAGDFFRPPGTFSFTNGISLFFGLLGCFVTYFWLHSKEVNRLLLLAATLALIAAIPLSISRALFFQVGVTLVFLVFAVAGKPKYIGKVLIGFMAVVIAFSFMAQTRFFQTATGAFSDRFETANETEGGLEGVLIGRYIGRMLEPLMAHEGLPPFGLGMGYATNVGSMFLKGSSATMDFEHEWARIIAELGVILGMSLIACRLIVSLEIFVACYRKLKSNDLLPWILLSLFLLLVPQGQWAQPTSLGFSTIVGGLTMSSLMRKEE